MAKDAGVRSVQELQAFGNQLKMLSSRTQEIFHEAQAKMAQVSEGWNDSQQEKFSVEFREYVKQIDQIASRMADHSEYIQHACAILQQYQSIR